MNYFPEENQICIIISLSETDVIINLVKRDVVSLKFLTTNYVVRDYGWQVG